jgi:hypothetical protein
MKKRKRPLATLEEAARRATFEALEPLPRVPDDIRRELVLGTFWEDDLVLFKLYVPKDRPSDAVVLSSAAVDAFTGEVVSVHINEDLLRERHEG